MATEGILSDISAIYKRLFNHRPVIQNEVHYFIKEFESKREDSDLKALQDAMRNADEINNVLLDDIMSSSAHFKMFFEKSGKIVDTCNSILDHSQSDLGLSESEQEQLEQQVEDYRVQLQQQQEEHKSLSTKETEQLKEEIRSVREARTKLRSQISSISSSITIFPPGTPSGTSSGEGSAEVSSNGDDSVDLQQQIGTVNRDSVSPDIEPTKKEQAEPQGSRDKTNSQHQVSDQ